MRQSLLIAATLYVAANSRGAEPVDLSVVEREYVLLQRQDVWREMGFPLDQMLAIRQAIPKDQSRERLRKLRLEAPSLSSAEKSQILAEVKREQVKSLMQALRPQQAERLTELRWQYEALDGFGTALGRAVELTDEQEKVIAEKEKELGEQLRERIRAFHRRSQRAFQDLLTPEQQSAWQRRIGPEFEFDSVRAGISAYRMLR